MALGSALDLGANSTAPAPGDKGLRHDSNACNGSVLRTPRSAPEPLGWNPCGGHCAAQDAPWTWNEQVQCATADS